MSKKTIRLTESQLKEYISKVVSEQNVPEQPQVQRPQVQQQKPQSGMTQAMLNSPYAKETKIWSDFFNKYYKMNLPVDGNWKNPEYNKTLARYYKEKNIPVYVCQTNDSYCGSGSEGVVTTKDKTGGELRAIRQQDMTKLGGQQPQPVNESQLINENISNDIEEYRMTSRRISQQLEAFEEMVKKGDIRRANEEKGTIYKYIGRLENILMSLKRRLM